MQHQQAMTSLPVSCPLYVFRKTSSQSRQELTKFSPQNSHTLLKNTGNILPLPVTGKSIAVIGDDGSVNTIVAGGGSGHVTPPYIVTPLQGIQQRLGSQAKVSYAPTNPISSAAKLASSVDYAIVCASFYSGEGSDRYLLLHL